MSRRNATALIDFESFAFTNLVVWAMKTSIARERPKDYGKVGIPAPGTTVATEKKVKFESFPSNHAATSFTAASLFFIEHHWLRLYGDPADGWACAGAFTVAASIAVARVMADNHYATDILAGAGIGIVSGWAIPRLLHFRKFTLVKISERTTINIFPVATPNGMALFFNGTI